MPFRVASTLEPAMVEIPAQPALTAWAWPQGKGMDNMRPPDDFECIINKTRYTTRTSTLLASDAFWDGHNFERHGRNTFLYKSPKGKYFAVTLSQWQGEGNSLEPLSLDAAVEMFEQLGEKELSFEEAFPGVEVIDA